MNLILTFLLLLSTAFSQIKAITTNGDSVLLNEDGTWSYENQIGNSSDNLVVIRFILFVIGWFIIAYIAFSHLFILH